MAPTMAACVGHCLCSCPGVRPIALFLNQAKQTVFHILPSFFSVAECSRRSENTLFKSLV